MISLLQEGFIPDCSTVLWWYPAHVSVVCDVFTGIGVGASCSSGVNKGVEAVSLGIQVVMAFSVLLLPTSSPDVIGCTDDVPEPREPRVAKLCMNGVS